MWNLEKNGRGEPICRAEMRHRHREQKSQGWERVWDELGDCY